MEEGHEKMVDAGADEGGPGNGQYPCPDNVASDAPAYGSKAMGSAYADNCTGDGVGGADRYPEASSCK